MTSRPTTALRIALATISGSTQTQLLPRYRGSTVTGIDLFIEDGSGRLINTDQIPFLPPDLLLASFGPANNGFADRMELLYAAEFQLEDIQADIIARGQITSVAAALPEPASLLLMCSGLGALLLRKKSRP